MKKINKIYLETWQHLIKTLKLDFERFKRIDDKMALFLNASDTVVREVKLR